ncbi:hypothetical protein PIB30_052613 [Stylosanthes scabra]|uniref:Uncharacterized protein n=1 Tax=Stylosanthes scabra TaxID=79078 RepID=A0ABU6SI76_9FABA|nr:hypothetical protein [Stylosanthes scabra]
MGPHWNNLKITTFKVVKRILKQPEDLPTLRRSNRHISLLGLAGGVRRVKRKECHKDFRLLRQLQPLSHKLKASDQCPSVGVELRRSDTGTIKKTLLKIGERDPYSEFGEHHFVHPQLVRDSGVIQIHEAHPLAPTGSLHPILPLQITPTKNHPGTADSMTTVPPTHRGIPTRTEATTRVASKPPQPQQPFGRLRDSLQFNST